MVLHLYAKYNGNLPRGSWDSVLKRYIWQKKPVTFDLWPRDPKIPKKYPPPGYTLIPSLMKNHLTVLEISTKTKRDGRTDGRTDVRTTRKHNASGHFVGGGIKIWAAWPYMLSEYLMGCKNWPVKKLFSKVIKECLKKWKPKISAPLTTVH